MIDMIAKLANPVFLDTTLFQGISSDGFRVWYVWF